MSAAERQPVVQLDRHGAVAVMRLNRPHKRNALSAELCDAIHRVLADWKTDPDVRAVVLTGAGTVFSAGFDLQEVAHPEAQARLVQASSRYHRTVWGLPKPIVCAVNGPALAGGFDLATLCDLRVAGVSATFAHPETAFGMPPLYTPLRWIVGDGVARDLCLTGRTIGSEEAQRCGLVSSVHVDVDLEAAALDIAAAIARVPPETLATFKRYASGAEGSFEAAFRAEHDEPFGLLLDGVGADVTTGGAERLQELGGSRSATSSSGGL